MTGVPKLKASGFINAEIATNTAANPTKTMKSCNKFRHCCHWNLYAIKAPIIPPIARKC